MFLIVDSIDSPYETSSAVSSDVNRQEETVFLVRVSIVPWTGLGGEPTVTTRDDTRQ